MGTQKTKQTQKQSNWALLNNDYGINTETWFHKTVGGCT